MDYLRIYCRYCFAVSNNHERGIQLRRETREYFKNHRLSNSLDADGHQKELTSLILSITSSPQGSLITNCNTQIKSALGYDKEDLINKSLSVIQQPVFSAAHELGFHKFLERWQIPEEDINKLIYPRTKSGFLTPVTVNIRIKPSLEQGLQMIGLMQPIGVEEMLPLGSKFEEEDIINFVVVDLDTNRIIGCSEKCGDLYGIYPQKYSAVQDF